VRVREAMAQIRAVVRGATVLVRRRVIERAAADL
jgi:hypothetical protein